MLNVKKILTKLLEKTIVENSTNNYITIGNFAMCWGRVTPSSVNSQNAITFPITFTSAPYGFATFNGDAKGNTYNQITAKNETTTGMTVYYYEAGGAVKQFNWLAVGFIGGGYFLKVFSRLAERWWEYAERKDSVYKNPHGTERVKTGSCRARRLHSIPSGRLTDCADRHTIGMVCDTIRRRQTVCGRISGRQSLQRKHVCRLSDIHKHFGRIESARLMGWHNIRRTVRILTSKNTDVFRGLTSERGWSCA